MTTSADRVDLVLNRAKMAAELTIGLDSTLNSYVPKSQLTAKQTAQLQSRANTMRDTIEQHLREPEIIRDTNAYMTLFMLTQKNDADMVHHIELARRVNSSVIGELNANNVWADHVGAAVHTSHTKKAFTPPTTTREALSQAIPSESLTWYALQQGGH